MARRLPPALRSGKEEHRAQFVLFTAAVHGAPKLLWVHPNCCDRMQRPASSPSRTSPGRTSPSRPFVSSPLAVRHAPRFVSTRVVPAPCPQGHDPVARQPAMIQDALDHRSLRDDSNEPHPPAARAR